MRPLRILTALSLLATIATISAWYFHDPLPAIRDELLAAARDPSNHAPYADLVRAELAAADRLQTTTFEMPCFWSGESHLGALPGVYRTIPGTQAGREVVRVEYDPEVTSPAALLAAPQDLADGAAACVYDPAHTTAGSLGPTFRPDDMPKWSIQQSDGLKYIPMTPAQAARVNAALHVRQPIEPLLSPGQVALWGRVRRNPGGRWTVYVEDERLRASLRQQVNEK